MQPRNFLMVTTLGLNGEYVRLVVDSKQERLKLNADPKVANQ